MFKPTVLLIEDDELLRRSLARSLGTHGFKVRSMANAESLEQELALACDVACVVMDMNLGRTDGLAAQQVVRSQAAHVPVVFISAEQDAQKVNQAWRGGAADFLFKPFTTDDLLRVIRARCPAEWADEADPCNDSLSLAGPNALTPRQMQVLPLLAQGLTNKEIAKLLDITPRTVKLHRESLMKRLGAKNLADVVRISDANANVLL